MNRILPEMWKLYVFTQRTFCNRLAPKVHRPRLPSSEYRVEPTSNTSTATSEEKEGEKRKWKKRLTPKGESAVDVEV